MKNVFPTFIFLVIAGVGLGAIYAGTGPEFDPTLKGILVAIVLIVALAVSSSIKIANPWERQ